MNKQHPPVWLRGGSEVTKGRQIKVMMETEKIEANHRNKELSARGFSIISLTCGIAMVVVGDMYWSVLAS